MNKLITISSALLTAAAVKAQTPNIVFILADDLGYGDISAFNPESKIHTPNIDKLAEHGIAFTDAHASFRFIHSFQIFSSDRKISVANQAETRWS